MLLAAKFTLGDKGINVAQLPMDKPQMSPQLRRTMITDAATETLPRIAHLAIVPPQDVGRANQPMFMRLIDLKPVTK